jgi:hypothetical protein
MPPRNPLASIARDLAALGARDRRAILKALEPQDRARITAAMRSDAPAAVPAVTPAASAHSPWFNDLIAAASSESGWPMTPAARGALLDAGNQTVRKAPRATGRSLLQAAGGLLAPAKLR